ncbi:hypothetical protein IMZ16_04125 [Cruoricaptor ignavus]|uniref:Uncharacterized protein n=1 Tax=Cruoricaptor ignavus TaxID=1118202 RepID=A0A7M1T412_9FLAO|nr:hypothetical protein [Cruoricaptor ignavus]QOR74628.1 hypothetical protein IMZ16_04125 [Cruoricaptor ignavus]
MVIRDFTIKKRTEKAMLVEFNLNGENITTWFPKSKITKSEDYLEIEEEFWQEKLEEVQNPSTPDSLSVFVEDYEQKEKSVRATLSCKVGNITISPWLFIPNKVCQILGENEGKAEIKIQKWFWNKAFPEMIQSQLDYLNKDRDEKEMFEAKDFTLLTALE